MNTNLQYRDKKPGTGNTSRFYQQDTCIQLEEKENEYILSMDTPGLSKRDIDVSIEKNMLIISSTKDTSHIDKIIRTNDHCEYELHQLKRAFALPSDAEVNAAAANWVNGTLFIHFPKHKQPFLQPLLKVPVS